VPKNKLVYGEMNNVQEGSKETLTDFGHRLLEAVETPRSRGSSSTCGGTRAIQRCAGAASIKNPFGAHTA